MKLLLALAVLLSLGSTASAERLRVHRVHHRPSLAQLLRRQNPAPQVVDENGQPLPKYQAWANRMQVPVVGGRVAVKLVDQPNSYGDGIGATTPGGPITLAPMAQGNEGIFDHELGHQFDYQKLSDPYRQRFAHILGDTRGWRDRGGLLEPLNERFADYYSELARFGPQKAAQGFLSDGAGEPTTKQWGQITGLLNQAGGLSQRLLARTAKRHRY